jgi:tryptophanyl-tRNA synthetase
MSKMSTSCEEINCKSSSMGPLKDGVVTTKVTGKDYRVPFERLLIYDCTMRILSGMQPSGALHLGNYLGALRRWVEEQHKDAYYCVVDLHALTLHIEPESLRENTTDLLASYLAAGLDPEVCTVFIQSQVSYHAQLNWLLECVATYGELSRMVAFKEKSERQEGYRVGLLTYPVLMAADILLYETQEVPVGDDQRQHLELTRVLAERFNNRFGETFTVPVGVQPPVAARVMDLQEPTRKMSKSVSSPLGTILVFDEPKEIERKISKAVTDTDGDVRFDWEKKPGVSNLLEIYSAFSGETPEQVAERYSRYGELKGDLAALMIETLTPLRLRYHELLASPDELYKVAALGAEKASSIAGPVYRRAAQAMGLV